MSYLLDKKIRKNKYLKIIFFVIFLFIFIYFRASIFNGLSYISSFIFRPVLILGNNIGEKLLNTGSYFYSKNFLLKENNILKEKINEQEARILNYNSVLDENLKIKEILGRKLEKTNMVLSSILAKPNQSPYDTLIIDVGEKDGILLGQRVFALGNIPIGRIAEVFANSSKVILFSNGGEKTEVIVSNNTIESLILPSPNKNQNGLARNAFSIADAGGDTFMQVIGRGGGNFDMILPRDFVLEKGVKVVLPGITPYVVGIVQTIVSDPRDAYQKAILTSPVNIQGLKFVEVEL
ncbi:MAG: rod shape-determining protein MreC [Candidatus Paceibacterota bacterium]